MPMRTEQRDDLAAILVRGRIARILSASSLCAAVAFLARAAHPAPAALALAVILLALGATGLAVELAQAWRERRTLVAIPLRVDRAHQAAPTQTQTGTPMLTRIKK
jgi:hypothetical protein